MKFLLIAITLLGCTSVLKAQENPVFRQPGQKLMLLNKKPVQKQSPALAPVDTLRGNILTLNNNLFYNIPCVKPDLSQFNMPNVAHTPQYKTTMLERYGDTSIGRITRKLLAK